MHQMLVAMVIILALPYLLWRLGKTEYWAPLVVVQILMGIALGPGVLGGAFPAAYDAIFTADVILMLDGLAGWGVILFVWLAGLELNLSNAWAERRDGFVTAGCALVMPMVLGAMVGAVLLWADPLWMGDQAIRWQFIAGIGMACAVTALPILVLFMKKLDILRAPLGQRVLRYASLDDLAIWFVLALVVVDFDGLMRQLIFLGLFSMAAWYLRRSFQMLPMTDRWFISMPWVALLAWVADWAGLHFMVGAFLAGAVMERRWFEEASIDRMREIVLLVLMPVFFLSTGLKTEWALNSLSILGVSMVLLIAAVAGKWLGVQTAATLLGWAQGEARIIAWLLQTKALIMIIFANILLDKEIISGEMFTSLLLMATFSTMLTIPMVMRAKRLERR